MIKLLFDFFPVILFFITFKIWGIYTATAVAIASSALQIILIRIKYHRFDIMHLITFCVLLFFGGATLFAKDPMFIKWKPTVAYWIFAIIFLSFKLINKKTFLERILSKKIKLPQKIWNILNISWIIFFTIIGSINLYFAYNYSIDTWVTFKLFGIVSATFIFGLIQSFYISKHALMEDVNINND